MNSNWLGRTAAAAVRGGLYAGAVALLLVGWGEVALGFDRAVVPELSPGAIGGALTLLSGGLLLLRERLRS